MKKALAVLLILACVLGLAACNGKPIIVSIEDTSKDSDLLFLAVIEPFYEDENNVYYFPYPISSLVIVTYLDGYSEGIIPALESGRATIEDLDRFGIEYYTDEK